ncbi:chromatin-remodeling ATPase INO80 [Nematocida minor]|uniref:chromatin-remodeling ATPase INO80 n=1 Tax=Nematocida minor TaxID=1912983 RepID=UPI00221E6C67|nr:chromatin-remodeling ATPase INO80 [Nematocida minor]KAI5192415.1 chromatin-remodeling ATPase INO80 [Nematocida minor]
MAAQEQDVADNIVQYQIDFGRQLRIEKMCRIERKVKRGFDAARNTLRTLGLDPSVLPQPSMDNYISFSNPEKELELLKTQQSTKDQITIGEETKKIYEEICKKSVPKIFKILVQNISTKQAQHKKISTVCQRELKRALTKTAKTNPFLKGKRITKELQTFFKRAERSSREKKKKEEKEDYERRKKEEEKKEEQRQEKKLNFLITQTELFSHFILGKKKQNEEIDEESKIAFEAAEKHRLAVKEFDTAPAEKEEKAQTVYNNSILPISEGVKIPKILQCTLKDYQKRGLEWLVSLYDQGINGMLADEMGLGKTVQAISFLAHLAENENIWGPFLIITPASTLHNWEQEFAKFVPSFKVTSYWGAVAERKAYRKSWQQRKLQREDSPFHVVITSYQLAVSDEKYFSKVKWQYMVLDEAQAIKSSSSTRWKTLLSFKTRSRLLLTGTPIQNTLQELWALLHFIMPTLFDSHGEFSEWFKIEDGDSVNEAARLRMVLQPFMLRREKKDVADELGQKIEKTIICELSPKQKRLYEGISARAPMASFLDKALPDDLEGMEGLMNLVMQFRKVCNHPDLFEKRETSSGWSQPATEVYIPRVLSDMAFSRKRKISDAVAVEDGDTFSKENFIVKTPVSKRIKLLVDDREESYSLFDEIVIPRCLPPMRKMVSPEVIPEETPAPAETLECIRQPAVYVPSMERFVSDSGKLVILDTLLPKLKEEGHRVLMYFQMTRMIDLFEEYLTVRNYSYLRLDGSSRISNRKELVKDWQSSNEKFIFLLSTRAGGLGINLTAADTVIFYDSDWNPTADQQAMDRAHRLGQTKQVTVYRLITAGTIEERIMKRAGVKGEIQRMVIKTRD